MHPKKLWLWLIALKQDISAKNQNVYLKFWKISFGLKYVQKISSEQNGNFLIKFTNEKNNEKNWQQNVNFQQFSFLEFIFAQVNPQETNTCSMWTKEASKNVRNMFKISNRNTRTTSINVALVSLLLTLSILHTFSQCFFFWLCTGKCLLGYCYSHQNLNKL